VRAVLVTGLAALFLAASASGGSFGYSADWLAEAHCVHLKEGPWTANTGNGYYGGMQFAAATWLRAGGAPQAAFKHPGDPRYPFRASVAEQLRRAYIVWKRDGGTWRSWGWVGASCAR
jgi:hypothetical protein